MKLTSPRALAYTQTHNTSSSTATTSNSIFARVRELVRLAPDADCAAVVPGGGAKVSAPGAAKLAAEARKAKGSRKKKKNGGGK